MSHGQGHGSGHHDPHLQHHFDTPGQQFAASKLGIWLFMVTEVLMFGGLFCAYAVYRGLHPEIFEAAHIALNKILGGANTLILISSSLTMALGVRAAQLGKQKALCVYLILTIMGGFGFMSIKYVEYSHKFHEGLLWGENYKPGAIEHAAEEEQHGGGGSTGQKASPAPAAAKPAAAAAPTQDPDMPRIPLPEVGPSGLRQERHGRAHKPIEPKNVQIFFGIYFAMTGLHGVHVLVGMILIGWALKNAAKGTYGPNYFTPVEIVGIYWHLVDLIWIFLFPLLYLIK